jgi:hypothetical protein
VKVWQSTELFISGDQRPATVKCRGRDQAISWIAMPKQGAAGENSDISRDWQHLQTKGLQQPGEIVKRADITLVTNNSRDFADYPDLRIESWVD